MKTMAKNGILLPLVLLAVLFNWSPMNAQTTWDYPVKPGTPEWEAFETHHEMIEAIQIPDAILSALTTKELVEICLNYPLSFDFYAYNNLQEGLRRNVAVHFNGVQELFRRQDNAQCLLEVLKGDDLLNMQALENVSSPSQIGKSIVRNSLTEVLLSHESVLANAGTEQQKEIAAVAMKNLLIKERNPQAYSHYGLEASAYLLGSTLKKGNSKVALSPGLEKFLAGGGTRDVTLLIQELMECYVKF